MLSKVRDWLIPGPYARKWFLAAVWLGIALGGIINVSLGSKVSTFTLILLYVSLGITGVTSQYWYNQSRMYRALSTVLVKELKRHDGN